MQNKLQKLIKPLNRFLFPKLKTSDEEYKYISLNMVTNLLGLGNAATPAGLKAVEIMNKKEGESLSDEIIMFFAINTASLQLIPTNVIAIRNSLGSSNSGIIIVGVWICSLVTFLTIVFLCKLYLKLRKR